MMPERRPVPPEACRGPRVDDQRRTVARPPARSADRGFAFVRFCHHPKWKSPSALQRRSRSPWWKESDRRRTQITMYIQHCARQAHDCTSGAAVPHRPHSIIRHAHAAYRAVSQLRLGGAPGRDPDTCGWSTRAASGVALCWRGLALRDVTYQVKSSRPGRVGTAASARAHSRWAGRHSCDATSTPLVRSWLW